MRIPMPQTDVVSFSLVPHRYLWPLRGPDRALPAERARPGRSAGAHQVLLLWPRPRLRRQQEVRHQGVYSMLLLHAAPLPSLLQCPKEELLQSDNLPLHLTLHTALMTIQAERQMQRCAPRPCSCMHAQATDTPVPAYS